ncbi:MAG: hypothetical protein DBY09_05425 [Selenomonadales bacterium]|nr:MAG: hypothetical protein DBY09_05425 [Selenomonadales bacterium]
MKQAARIARSLLRPGRKAPGARRPSAAARRPPRPVLPAKGRKDGRPSFSLFLTLSIHFFKKTG